MEIVVRVDEATAKRAADAARAANTSLDQVLRETLERLAAADAERDCAEMAELTRQSTGRMGGWAFDRDDRRDLPAGARVRVVRVEGTTLRVEPSPD